MKRELAERVMRECYRMLYLRSTPSADFDLLVQNAETVIQMGREVKSIPMDDYSIPLDILDGTISEVCRKYKLNSYWTKKVSEAVYLGCSPRTMSVVCKDDKCTTSGLTKGRDYKVHLFDGEMYKIKDDNNELKWYSTEFFE
jgi:hypothetical protein